MERSFVEKLEAARQHVGEMFVARGARVVSNVDCGDDRFLFRVVAVREGRTGDRPTVYAALFCDVTAGQCTRDGQFMPGDPASPSIRATKQAVVQAHKGVELYREDRLLVVLLLRANSTAEKPMGRQARLFMSQVNKTTPSLRLEAWHLDELLYNPLQNELVPPHTLLTPIQRKMMLRRYGRNFTDKAPRLATGDPVARWLEFRPGDLVLANEVDSKRGHRPYVMHVV